MIAHHGLGAVISDVAGRVMPGLRADREAYAQSDSEQQLFMHVGLSVAQGISFTSPETYRRNRRAASYICPKPETLII